MKNIFVINQRRKDRINGLKPTSSFSRIPQLPDTKRSQSRNSLPLSNDLFWTLQQTIEKPESQTRKSLILPAKLVSKNTLSLNLKVNTIFHKWKRRLIELTLKKLFVAHNLNLKASLFPKAIRSSFGLPVEQKFIKVIKDMISPKSTPLPNSELFGLRRSAQKMFKLDSENNSSYFNSMLKGKQIPKPYFNIRENKESDRLKIWSIKK